MGRLQLVSIMPEKLSNAPFDVIPFHRRADFPAHGDPEPAFFLLTRCDDHDEVRAFPPAMPALEPDEFPSFPDPQAARVALPSAIGEPASVAS